MISSGLGGLLFAGKIPGLVSKVFRSMHMGALGLRPGLANDLPR